ncbi:uncharacterized protein LOC107646588 [Arachis ipaensis]|uniref:uncharacterized protein LOC107646588 n=1 Tax=Arachis ipaensis TaxID=130454 RepID=UPI0007AF9DB4|nr:uncharacterized protein LOC107646588 [Arachis ipaensis]
MPYAAAVSSSRRVATAPSSRTIAGRPCIISATSSAVRAGKTATIALLLHPPRVPSRLPITRHSHPTILHSSRRSYHQVPIRDARSTTPIYGDSSTRRNTPPSRNFKLSSTDRTLLLQSLTPSARIICIRVKAQRALRSKNKVKFLDGSIPKPAENQPLFETWDRCNNILLSWLNLSLFAEITKSVMWISNASDLWKDLKNRYSHGDVFRVGELKEEFYTIRQGDLVVTSYFTKLKSVWEELENLHTIPSCIACVNGCNCRLKIIRDYASEEYVVKFFRGLNEQYSAVKSQIMLLKPLPDINVVLAMLTQQERELSSDFLDTKIITNSMEVQHQQRGSYSSRGRGRGRSGGKKNTAQKTFGKGYTSKLCTYCNRIGHLVENCYKKNGFPAHWKQKSANHISTEGEIEDSGAGGDITDSGQEEGGNETALVLTLDQKQTLIALLQQPLMTASSRGVRGAV